MCTVLHVFYIHMDGKKPTVTFALIFHPCSGYSVIERTRISFPHVQFMAQSVLPPQSVTKLGTVNNCGQGHKPDSTIRPLLTLHFNNCVYTDRK